MNRQIMTNRWPLVARNRRSSRRRSRDRLLFESLETRHLLSGNWVMDTGPAGTVAAAGPDGSVYTIAQDQTGTYNLSRYDSSGLIDPTMSGVPLFAGNGLKSMFVDSSGIYVGGTFTENIDFDMDGIVDPTATDLISAGDTDVFIAKFPSDGAGVWSQRFGGPEADSLVAFDVDSSGNVFATGTFGGTATFSDPSSTILVDTISNYVTTFVFKLDDGDGSPIWARQLQDAGGFSPRDMDASDTHVFLIGTAERCRLNGVTYDDPVLVKMDGDGSADRPISWVHQYAEGVNFNWSLALVHHGNVIYVTGDVLNLQFSEGVGTLTTTDKPFNGRYDGFVLAVEDQELNASNQWVRQFRSSTMWAKPLDIAVVGANDPDPVHEPTLAVAGRFNGTTYFDYDHVTGTPGDLEPLTARGNAAFINDFENDVYLAEMKLDGTVQRVRQLGGVDNEDYAKLVTRPAIDAINLRFSSGSDILHTPGGSLAHSQNGTGVLTHINRQAPQLEVVHVFEPADPSRDEIILAVEEGRLTFAANVDGNRTSPPVTWNVDGIAQLATGAELTLADNSLALGRHEIVATVPFGNEEVSYNYIFDVTPNAPTNVTATLANRVVRVTWQDNSNLPATQETGFKIFRRSIVPEGVWTLVGSTGPGTTSFVDATVARRTDYEYVVRSVVELPDGRVFHSPAVDLASTLDAPTVLPVVSIVATDANAAETGLDPGTFTVTRTGSTAGDLTIPYAVAGTATAGSDYITLVGPATIPSGSSSATITVQPIDDLDPESPETVMLTLQSGAGYTVDGGSSSATVSITDNDTTYYEFPSTDVPKTIADPHPKKGPTPVTSTLTIAGTGLMVGTIDINVSINHASMSDLTARLTSPVSSVYADLTYASGVWSVAPSAFAGVSLDGTWKLTVTDTVKNGVTGTLQGWSLLVTPAAPRLVIPGSIPATAELQARVERVDTVWSRVARHDAASFPFVRGAASPQLVDQVAIPSMQQHVLTYRAENRLRVGTDRAIDRALAEESFVNDPFYPEEARWMWSL